MHSSVGRGPMHDSHVSVGSGQFTALMRVWEEVRVQLSRECGKRSDEELSCECGKTSDAQR